jgi:hypothetical protein
MDGCHGKDSKQEDGSFSQGDPRKDVKK